MIKMKPEDMLDQTGMERAFADYFQQLAEQDEVAFNNMLDPRFVSCDFAQRSLTLRMEAKPWMVNPGGILHGGITASLMDFVMGVLARYYGGGYMTPTVSMEMSYLRPGPAQNGICFDAKITRLGRTLIHTTGSLWVEGAPDRLVATSTGVYYVNREFKA